MPAYLIVDIDITDPVKYADYIKAAPASIAAYGGKYIVRGGKAQRIEGSWNPNRVVVLQFETYERALEWWASEEYREPKALRQSASVSNMILVEGL